MRSPEHTSWIALATPTRRGSRCVPPAPGIMPSVTSGSPTTVPGSATRASQPSASSNPPPSAAPCNAATTGLATNSMARMTAGNCGSSSGLPNSRRSEPATKVVPWPMMTAARSVASSASIAIDANTPRRTESEPALIGGLSIRITSTSPSRSTPTLSVTICITVP